MHAAPDAPDAGRVFELMLGAYVTILAFRLYYDASPGRWEYAGLFVTLAAAALVLKIPVAVAYFTMITVVVAGVTKGWYLLSCKILASVGAVVSTLAVLKLLSRRMGSPDTSEEGGAGHAAAPRVPLSDPSGRGAVTHPVVTRVSSRDTGERESAVLPSVGGDMAVNPLLVGHETFRPSQSVVIGDRRVTSEDGKNSTPSRSNDE